MNLEWIDWLIIVGLFGGLVAIAEFTNKYTKSVADFLSAGRLVKRYILTTANGLLAAGATTVIANFQMTYEAGFTRAWWLQLQAPAMLLVTLSGWVACRWRQTRVMSFAQFYELRYSKPYRIYVGFFGFCAGVFGFSIVPAIGARFFVHYLGLPESIPMAGLQVPTFPLAMAFLLVTALMFTVRGGQITVMVTDFAQGVFCNVLYLLIVAFILISVDWSTLMEGISYTAPEASKVHPFHTSATRDYNHWFFLISVFYILVLFPADGANQAPNSSARNAHEARMGWILSNVRSIIIGLAFLLLPILAYTVMHHPDFASMAASVTETIEGQDDQIQREILVPVVMAHFLPAGLVGGFAALMLAAFIACADSYLHGYGSTFIQDMVLPFRKKPFSPTTHLLLLRIAVIGVAVIVFFLGLFYKPRQDIQMFWALLMTFSAGAAIIPLIGGLYWKWGTTAGAWASAATGAILSVIGFWIRRYHPEFPMNAQVMSFFIVLLCIANFALVSLLDHLLRRRPPFNMDRMLHRGKYAAKEDHETEESSSYSRSLLFRILGIGKEFSKSDIAIYFGVVAWTGLWFALFVAGTAYSLLFDPSPEAWERYWRFYIWTQFGVGAAVVILFAVGGLANFRDLVRELRSEERNVLDNGMVVGHTNLEDVTITDGESGAETPLAPVSETAD